MDVVIESEGARLAHALDLINGETDEVVGDFVKALCGFTHEDICTACRTGVGECVAKHYWRTGRWPDGVTKKLEQAIAAAKRRPSWHSKQL